MNISSPESVGMSSDRLANIGLKFQSYVDNKNAPGFSTLVARKGKVIHFETCGYRDAEKQLPVEKDTIFRIYSMTKPITSIALMMLYEQGKFQLFEPVGKYIPEFKKTKVFNHMGYAGEELVEQTPPMNIRHLLTHTSGLCYGWFKDSPVEEFYRSSNFNSPDNNLEEMVRGLAELPLRFQPGSAWHYSLATDVLGYLVQVIAGMPFEDFLEEKILAPLGMEDTSFCVPASKMNRFAQLYYHNPDDGSFRTYQENDLLKPRDYSVRPKAPSGGGGLVSTTADYYRFAQMLCNRGALGETRIVGRKTLEYMTINHLRPKLLPLSIGPIRLGGLGFGLGFSVVVDPAEAAVTCSLGNYGWRGVAATNFWVDPGEEIVGIIMTQLMANTHPFSADFRALTYQALVD